MLREAVEIIRSMFEGGYVGYEGRHFQFDSAKLWDLPSTPPPIGIAVSGHSSAGLAGDLADVMIAVEPKSELGQMFDDAGGSGKPRYGQLAVSFDEDVDAAVERAWDQFRWFSGGWKINAELPGTAAFAAASQAVRHEDVAAQIPCGPDVERHLDGIRQFADAGFTHLALVQIGGGQQQSFIHWAERELLPLARKL
jgi:G6PDH family F420-dependent oxidoreductase